MKYIKLKVQDKDSCNYVLAGIMYLEYNDKINSMVIYSLNTVDVIYLDITKKDYEKILDNLAKKDFISINLCGYTQPFENFENDKKGKQYIELDKTIKDEANKNNKNKSIVIGV